MLDNLIQVSGQPNVKLNNDKSSKKESPNDDFEKYMQKQSTNIKDDKALKSKKQEKKQDTTNDKTEAKTIQKNEIKSSKDDNLKGELNPNEVFGTLFSVLKIAKALNLSPNLSAPIRELKQAKTVGDIVNIAKKYNLNITKIEFSTEEEKLDIKTALNDKNISPKIFNIVEMLEQKMSAKIQQQNQIPHQTTQNKTTQTTKKLDLASILQTIQKQDNTAQINHNEKLSKKSHTNDTKPQAIAKNTNDTNDTKIINTDDKIKTKITQNTQKDEKPQAIAKNINDTNDIKEQIINTDDKTATKITQNTQKDEKPQAIAKNINDTNDIKEQIINTDDKIETKITQNTQKDEKPQSIANEINNKKEQDFVAIDENINQIDLNIPNIVDKIIKTNKEQTPQNTIKEPSQTTITLKKENIDGEKLLGNLLKGLKNNDEQNKTNFYGDFAKTIEQIKTKETKLSPEQFFTQKYQNTEKTNTQTITNTPFYGIKPQQNTQTTTTFVKQTLPSFTNDLKEVVEKYRPPVSRVKISLNPVELGEIEVSVSVRGKNLNIQLNSQNQTTTNLFIAYQTELKNTLVAMGFAGLDMSFSQKKDENEAQKKNQQNPKKDKKEDEENKQVMADLNIPVDSLEIRV